MSCQTFARTALVFPLLALSLTAEAATVGFWQFNRGAFLEDSAGNSDLTLNGAVSQVNLPAAGRGAKFPGTSPAADSAGGVGDRLLTTITPIAGSFSIEAYIHTDNADGLFADDIATSRTSSADFTQIAWAFEIRHDGFAATLSRELILIVGQGDVLDTARSGFQIDTGNDYYVASVFDLAGKSTSFYVKDLTNAGPLMSNTASHNLTALNSNSTLVIGNASDAADTGLDGLIDEVRLSNTALSSSELLINTVPLPAAVWLFGAALSGLGFARLRIAK